MPGDVSFTVALRRATRRASSRVRLPVRARQLNTHRNVSSRRAARSPLGVSPLTPRPSCATDRDRYQERTTALFRTVRALLVRRRVRRAASAPETRPHACKSSSNTAPAAHDDRAPARRHTQDTWPPPLHDFRHPKVLEQGEKHLAGLRFALACEKSAGRSPLSARLGGLIVGALASCVGCDVPVAFRRIAVTAAGMKVSLLVERATLA